MKYEEFGVKVLLGALKRQWKFLVVFVLIFALVGAGAGLVFAYKGAGKAMGGAEALPVVSLSKIKMDSNYYASCRDHLVSSYNIVVAYQKDFAGRMELTEEQKQTMEDILLQLQKSGIALNEINKKLSAAGAVYKPKELLDDYIDQCEYYLKKCRQKLELAQLAAEMLASMDAPTIQSDATINSYDLIISTAASVFEEKQNVQFYEEQLETLKNRPAVLRAETQMKQMQADAAKELSEIAKTLSEEADSIAKEKNVIYNMQQNGSSDVQFTLRHTHSESTVQESFVLITLFCVLTGVCAGIFFAISRECRGQKKEQAE